MTPAEHLAEAERLIATVSNPDGTLTVTWDRAAIEKSVAHAVIALAAELGVPHSGAGGGGDSAQAQATAG